MAVDQALDLRDVVDPALAERARRHHVTDAVETAAGEPDVRWRIPAGLLHPHSRLLGKDPRHRGAQESLGDAVPDLVVAGDPEHELDEAVVEERVESLEPEVSGVPVLGAKAAGGGLPEEILKGAI